jgi:hypothetical protein
VEHSEKVSLLVDLQSAANDMLIVESLSGMKHGEYIVGLWKKTINQEIGKMFGESQDETIEGLNKLQAMLGEISKTPIMQLLTQFYAKYNASTLPQSPQSEYAPVVQNPPSRGGGIYPY